jgi:hypothetical protein
MAETVVPKFDGVLGVFVDSKTGVPIPTKLRARPKPVSPIDFEIDTRSVFDKDASMLGPIVTRDENGFLIDKAGKKSLPIKPRKVYRRGTHWRIVGENVRIEAICNYGTTDKPLRSGWARVLPVGTIVECIGWRKYQGTVAPQFIYPGLPDEAVYSTIWPHDSVFRPWPLTGMLEEVSPEIPTTDPEAEELEI